MKIRKKLTEALVLLTLTASSATASAEHPSAQRYREMLRSDNFYLEYEMVDDSKKNNQMGYSHLEVLSSEDGKRLVSSVQIKRGKQTSWVPGIVGLLTGGGGTKVKRGSKAPKALCANGNYYIFGSPFTMDITQLMAQMMNEKPAEAHVCSAARINDPQLDPTEGWSVVRNTLELPDALTVFTDDDSYQVRKGHMKINPIVAGAIAFSAAYRDYNMPPRTSPTFVESRKITLEKKEYDCDRYTADIKTTGGTVAAQILYDVLYDGEGNLSQIRRYFFRNGKEESLGNMEIWKLTAELPEDAFFISDKPTKVYAAGMGDANDFLGIDVQIGTIGGASTNAE